MDTFSPVQNQISRLASSLAGLNQPTTPEKMGTMAYAPDVFGEGASGGAASSFMAKTPGKFGFGMSQADSEDTIFGTTKLGYRPAPAITQNAQQVASQLGNSGDAAMDRFNVFLSQSASSKGIDPVFLKAILYHESNGNWERDGGWSNSGVFNGTDRQGQEVLPFSGITRGAAESWGLNYNAMMQSPQAQIDGMATILAGLQRQYGNDPATLAKVWFGGGGALSNPGGYTDPLNQNSNAYAKEILSYYQRFNQSSGGGSVTPINGMWGGNAVGNGIVNIATSFVNKAPYIWGSVPGKGTNPAVTGWDCSGMISWLDKNYGTGQVPDGSHYQYQYFKNSGQIFSDPNQLRPGDVVFFDTGDRSGGGANLNGASHVAMYIGNGQIVHAANPNSGTIISNLAAYQGMYGYLGAAHMGWSGGGAGSTGGGSASFSSPGQNFRYFMQGGRR